MADYAAKPTKAKEDTAIIELRKRMLAVFLNRCRRMKEIREDGVWWRFLDPNVSWVSCAPSNDECSLVDRSIERGTAFPPGLFRTEEQPQSSSPRSRKPDPSSWLVTGSFLFREAQGRRSPPVSRGCNIAYITWRQYRCPGATYSWARYPRALSPRITQT